MQLNLKLLLLGIWCASLLACTTMTPNTANLSEKEAVFATERNFARSMAERDFNAFSAFVSDEAVFFDDNGALRGKQAVLAAWARYFRGEHAPFAWEPDQVEVLDSGTLALSTGPVRDPTGRVIARFNSVWRQEAPGVWRVVFDKGSPP